jgi:hypothetical protein
MLLLLAGCLCYQNAMYAGNSEFNSHGKQLPQDSLKKRISNDTVYIDCSVGDSIGNILLKEYPDIIAAKILFVTKKSSSFLEMKQFHYDTFNLTANQQNHGDIVIITDMMILSAQGKKKKKGAIVFTIK